jgi:hypothetical protein
MKTHPIIKRLNEFIETAKFDEYKFPDDHKLKLSEGCKALLKQYDAAFLFDLILFVQLSKKEVNLTWQVWTFNKGPGGKMKVTCDFEHGQYLMGNSVTAIDFPLDEVKVIVNNEYTALAEEVYYEPE